MINTERKTGWRAGSLNRLWVLQVLTGTGVLVALAALPSAQVGRGAREVSGAVVSAATQLPVPGANIQYEESGQSRGRIQPASSRTHMTTTDAKGAFELPAGHLGVVQVTARGFGTARRRWPPLRGRSRLRIELHPPAIVSGTVVDAVTGSPLPAKVRVIVKHPENYVSHGVMAEKGTFEAEDLPPGPGLMVASSDGYAPTVGSFTAEAGKTRDARIGLLLEAQATGRVVDGSGEPVQWAFVRATYPDMTVGGTIETLVSGQPWTDAEGNFVLEGLAPDTTLALQAELNGLLSSTEWITVGPGMRRNGVVLTLQ